MRKDFLVFGSPAIDEAEIAEVVATLRSGWIATGPRVARFEEMFREYWACPLLTLSRLDRLLISEDSAATVEQLA